MTSEPFSLSRTWNFSLKKSAPSEALRRAPPTYTLAQAHGERVLPNVSSVCTAMIMLCLLHIIPM